MTRLRGVSAAAASLLACSSAPRHPDHVAPGDYSYARTRPEWMVRNAMAKHGLKGVSLASRGVPATAETPFRIGSVSKLFTALEVVRLAEMGRVDLDRDIAEFVPGFAIRSRFKGARPIAPRALLAHHSGRMTAWPRSTREQPGGNLPWDIEIDHGASASVESILVRIARRVTGGGESGRQ